MWPFKSKQVEGEKKRGYFKRKGDAFVDGTKKSLGVHYIESGASFIKENAQYLNPLSYKDREVREETFRQSCERFGIKKESDLAVVYQGLFTRFYTLAGLSFFIFLWAFYQAFEGNFIVVLACFSILLACLTSVAVTSFRMAQIYARDWFDFKVFLNDSSLWFPKNWPGAKASKRNEVN